MAGFGGVAEYGITVRWDKNFLKIIRLLLERRARVRDVRRRALRRRPDHRQRLRAGLRSRGAVRRAPGRPTVIPMKNGLARGVRQASDFLMALQLTGAAKTRFGCQSPDPHADRGDRRRAYGYRYGHRIARLLRGAGGEIPAALRDAGGRKGRSRGARRLDATEESETADEFLAMRAPFAPSARAAAQEGRKPNLIGLLNSWGGVTIAYRRRMIDSPSYTLNHEEVWKALEEGIRFAERLTPRSRRSGSLRPRGGAARGTSRTATPACECRLASILVAAERSRTRCSAAKIRTMCLLDGKWFQAVDEERRTGEAGAVAKPQPRGCCTSLRPDGRGVSFFGDLHPSYAGNV